MAGLRAPECLMCRQEKADLERYYFWFVEEQYANAPTMVQLQQAQGFCLWHTRHLLARGARDRISYVAGYVLGFCADRLRSLREAGGSPSHDVRKGGGSAAGGFAPASACPACQQGREGRERQAYALVSCLREGDVREAFQASHGLCLAHFLTAAWLAPWETLQFLAAEQVRRLEATRTKLEERGPIQQDDGPGGILGDAVGRIYGPDQDEVIREFVVAGRRSDDTFPQDGRGGMRVPAQAAASWSPAFDVTIRLLSLPGCSLCRVAACSREEYMAWLEEEIREHSAVRHRWDQMQYLCAEHAWQFARRCAPSVLSVACERLAAGTAERLRELLWEIREPIPQTLLGRVHVLPARWRAVSRPENPGGRRPPLLRRARRTLATVWHGPRNALDRALLRTLYRNVCPVCHCVETAERRAALRLLAVLEDREGRRAFERSYALCLRHAPLVLGPRTDPGLRRYLAGVLLARVEVDRWEAEEYLRKSAWGQRHEPKGAEEAAWLRAITRIAGVAMERRYGF